MIGNIVANLAPIYLPAYLPIVNSCRRGTYLVSATRKLMTREVIVMENEPLTKQEPQSHHKNGIGMALSPADDRVHDRVIN